MSYEIKPELIEELDRIFPDSLSKVTPESSQFALGELIGERRVVDKIKSLYKQQSESGAVHVHGK